MLAQTVFLWGLSSLGIPLGQPMPWHRRFRIQQTVLEVTVALPSGRNASLSLPKSSKVEDLKTLALEALGQSFSRLLTADGRILTNPMEPLEAAGLQDGDWLTAVVGQAQLAATGRAFALCRSGGERVLAWGDPDSGGAVGPQLRGVHQIQATWEAFVAILDDGSVVTWGSSDYGGDSFAVQDLLNNVQQIQATRKAFAAILKNGFVVTSGNRFSGGDSSAVQHHLRNVQQIQDTTFGAFAAIREDGSVVTWAIQIWVVTARQFKIGWGMYNRFRPHMVRLLRSAKMAPLFVTWGSKFWGGDSSAVQDQLKGVQQIQGAAFGAFAAIREDGSVVTWGHSDLGGDSSAVQDRLRNVQQIQAKPGAFAAIREDGSVVCYLGRSHS